MSDTGTTADGGSVAWAVARALEPLYGLREPPDAIARRAADAVAGALGRRVRIELPAALGIPAVGAALAHGAWALRFGPDGEGGRIWVEPPAPDPATAGWLQLELERLHAYLALLRDVGAAFDRLEFRLRALHQIARTLSVARDESATESLIVDFTGELFFTWWAALARPGPGGAFAIRATRALRGRDAVPALPADALATFAPVGSECRAVPIAERPAWMPEEARAFAPLDIAGERLGCLLVGDRMNEEPYDENDLQLLATVAHASATALRNAQLLDRLKEQAILDDLTGLYNRRFFEAQLQQEFDRARRYGRSLSLVLIDIDHFKAYNDDFGHTAGDLLLARIGALLRADIRKVDTVCRYGGEEFAVIAPETTHAQALGLAQRIQQAIRNLEPVSGIRRRVTASFGTAAFPEHAADPAGLVEAADRALYRAKAEGRDRIASP